MLGGYPSEEMNRRYEDAYCALFNGATVPFYWKDLEPVQGCPRYHADSPFIARRPPPDQVIAFCRKRGLRMHGHTLVWDHADYSVPDWLDRNPDRAAGQWEAHVKELGRLYGNIERWDVLNEAVPQRGLPVSLPMPTDYEFRAFDWARQHFPEGTRFYINEIPDAWTSLLPRYKDMVQRLIDRGVDIGGIGLQFHLFRDQDLYDFVAGKLFVADKLLAALDELATFGLPVHISEITLTSPENSASGQAMQASVARALYRLWFSHPIVDAITWWNVPDGGAVAGENHVYPGLLNSKLEPKPSYRALHDLIHREWRTDVRGKTNAVGEFVFRGFLGSYQISVENETSAELLVSTPRQFVTLTLSSSSSRIQAPTDVVTI